MIPALNHAARKMLRWCEAEDQYPLHKISPEFGQNLIEMREVMNNLEIMFKEYQSHGAGRSTAGKETDEGEMTQRWVEAGLWIDFCSPLLTKGGRDNYWAVTDSTFSAIEDKDACIKAAAEHDQKAKDKLVRYAIWRLKS